MNEILSKKNSKLKFARKVASGRVPDRVFVEGVRLVSEILKAEIEITDTLISSDFERENHELMDALVRQEVQISVLPVNVFDSIAETKTSQGIILICVKPKTGQHLIETKLDNNLAAKSPVIMLHKVNNPSNLGAVFRTAEAINTSGIITTVGSADALSPKAIRGSMGASLRIPIWQDVGFDDALIWASENRLITTCADINSPTSYTEIDWKKQRLIVFGSEAHGLSEKERGKIDESIFIPMENDVESLNLAVSCGIVFYEIKRQQAG